MKSFKGSTVKALNLVGSPICLRCGTTKNVHRVYSECRPFGPIYYGVPPGGLISEFNRYFNYFYFAHFQVLEEDRWLSLL